MAQQELKECGIRLQLDTRADAIARLPDGGLQLGLQQGGRAAGHIAGRYVFNCTYSGLNQLGGDFPGTRVQLKQEITEMALLQVPPELQQLGITVMDGPFFSLMPFPARGLHTLSHVRYTPHLFWADQKGIDPYRKLASYEGESRANRMLRDVARYIPAIGAARYSDSLLEIKTVLQKNENDDGRPILFERHSELPGCYSILGGKIDNIYDVLEKLDEEIIQI